MVTYTVFLVTRVQVQGSALKRLWQKTQLLRVLAWCYNVPENPWIQQPPGSKPSKP